MPAAMTDDGTSISYESAGEGPPNLLCMHGWAGSGRYFDATIEQLDLTRVRAVTFDLRGHGRSDPAAGGFTLDRIAADALAVADAAGLDEFVVLGFSMSAKFAQYLALAAPERVGGLILVAGCPAARSRSPPSSPTTGSGARATPRGWPRSRRLRLEPDRAGAARALRRGRRDDRPRGARGHAGRRVATSFMDRVGAIVAPALVVGGRHDAMFTPELLREAVTGPLPGARLALLDAGHEVGIELPGQLAALVEAFLGGLGERRVAKDGARFARALGAKPGSLLPSGG